MERVQKSWKELKHEASKRTDVHNLIRGILEKDLKQPLNPHKPMLNLGLGEPSRANGFELPAIINEIMVDTVRAELSNGYTIIGTEAARKAIVKKFSHPDFPFTENEVVLSFGCSGALYNSISAMCETGDNILVPRPGFPLCLPIAQNIGIELKFYDLLPEKGWEIDLDQLRSLVDDKTKAILVNNPSNPCGSCFSKKHCEDILQVANEVKVPIISDEVYYGLAYDHEVEFHSMGNLSKEVPVICVSSISKIYCLPGWRLGWSIAYNHHGYFDNVIANMQKHANVQLHPTSLVQTALPRILEEVQEDHFISLKSKLKEASDFAYEKISQIRGLSPIKASAAMYMMVKINMEEFADIEDDIDFCKKFLNEECTLIFPAQSIELNYITNKKYFMKSYNVSLQAMVSEQLFVNQKKTLMNLRKELDHSALIITKDRQQTQMNNEKLQKQRLNQNTHTCLIQILYSSFSQYGQNDQYMFKMDYFLYLAKIIKKYIFEKVLLKRASNSTLYFTEKNLQKKFIFHISIKYQLTLFLTNLSYKQICFGQKTREF